MGVIIIASVASSPSILEHIVGQSRAREILSGSLAHPVHAYLFLGPAGSGKLAAARTFATALVCPEGGCGICAVCHDAASGLHPDISYFEREGASISVDDAHEIAMAAQRSPSIARHQILILNDFHLVAGAAPALLKTIEEPPVSTIFLIVADALPTALVTLASRCLTVPFVSLSTELLESVLRDEGVDEELVAPIAYASLGNLDRARLLVGDSGFRDRQSAWRSVPDQLEGTGASAARVGAEILSRVDEIVDVLKARQIEELAQLTEASRAAGDRSVQGQKAIEERHRREQRRVRTDELRAGLASLSGVYLHRLRAPNLAARRLGALTNACALIDEVAHFLSRNPNESLLLQSLFTKLGDLTG